MTSVLREVTIDAPAADCWSALRDFSALHERLVPGFVTSARMLGEREREVTFASGAVAREYLISIDDATMRLAYTVTDGPMESSHHNASAQIVTDPDGNCRFVWVTDVLPDSLADRTADMMDAGLRVIKATLEAGVSPL